MWVGSLCASIRLFISYTCLDASLTHLYQLHMPNARLMQDYLERSARLALDACIYIAHAFFMCLAGPKTGRFSGCHESFKFMYSIAYGSVLPPLVSWSATTHRSLRPTGLPRQCAASRHLPQPWSHRSRVDSAAMHGCRARCCRSVDGRLPLQRPRATSKGLVQAMPSACMA